ncbi:MAG TPA: DUF2254 family protein [Polyangiaceae bacterium]|jgi:hypothetical protein|nr:DUF2254 family protein [Polyangiaceae bacterium]
MTSESPSLRRTWALRVGVLFSVAVVAFWSLYSIDFFLTGKVTDVAAKNPFAHYIAFDPGSISDAISSLAGNIAAVFGLVITVVSIIVQLSADRYTGVTRMFFRDRLNMGVLAYYLVACVFAVWLSVSLKHDYVPRVVLLSMLALTTTGLLMMAPYFGYVFWFLEPETIVNRIRSDAVKMATKGAALAVATARFEAQASTLFAMEELTDITSNSISGKDKIIASGAVDALKDFAVAYIKAKPSAVPEWFSVGPSIRENPDFVAMDPESLGELEQRRTWVEWKVMRQYLGIYNEALASMRDINYLVAIDTRYIGEAAVAAGDRELINLVYRFMNSYMRTTLNARDVRTAYNVLNQYRILVEAMLRNGNGEAALEGVKYMKYYGHVSFDMKLTFVTETVAYDVSALCEVANQVGASQEAGMLGEFLELDQPLLAQSQEKGLLGVRKAQVKLASYYLLTGQEEKARTICRDMAGEPRERLLTIRQQLEVVTSKDFWEIIDRGRNFEFMPPEQKECMKTFFSWLPLGEPVAKVASAE